MPNRNHWYWALVSAMLILSQGCAQLQPEGDSEPAASAETQETASADEAEANVSESAAAEGETAGDAEDTAQSSSEDGATADKAEEAAQTAEASGDDSAVAEAKALAPQRVTQIIDQFVDHPRVLYSRSSNAYAYYIGGRLRARYHPDEGVLQVAPDSPAKTKVADSDALVCKYNQSGELQKVENSDPKGPATCNRLMSELESFLSL